jgi:hypothetical protein
MSIMDKLHSRRFVIIVIALSILGILLYRINNPSLGFTYYAPAYLPPGVTIKQRRITTDPGGTSVDQDFRTVDWVYDITEYKRDNASIGSANQNFSVSSREPTCSIRVISSQQLRYRVCHWVDYGRISVYEVKFIKGGTFIYSQIPTPLSQPINLSIIDHYVSSFTSKSAAGLQILRSEGP